MISAICFDFDGTLVDSNQIKKEVMLAAADDLPGGRAEMTRIMTENPFLDRFGIFNQLARHFDLQDDMLDQRLTQFNQDVHDAVVAAPFMPGAERLLGHLRQSGIPAFLNSATPEIQLQAIVRDRNMTNLFAGIYGRPATKPDNIRRAMKETAQPATNILMVGDGADDQDGAEQAGCAFQAVFDFRGTVTDDMTVLDDLRGLITLV